MEIREEGVSKGGEGREKKTRERSTRTHGDGKKNSR